MISLDSCCRFRLSSVFFPTTFILLTGSHILSCCLFWNTSHSFDISRLCWRSFFIDHLHHLFHYPSSPRFLYHPLWLIGGLQLQRIYSSLPTDTSFVSIQSCIIPMKICCMQVGLRFIYLVSVLHTYIVHLYTPSPILSTRIWLLFITLQWFSLALLWHSSRLDVFTTLIYSLFFFLLLSHIPEDNDSLIPKDPLWPFHSLLFIHRTFYLSIFRWFFNLSLSGDIFVFLSCIFFHGCSICYFLLWMMEKEKFMIVLSPPLPCQLTIWVVSLFPLGGG